MSHPDRQKSASLQQAGHAPSESYPSASPRPGVLLSFDDAPHIPHWLAAAPMLQRQGARVTFFIHRFDLLPDASIDALRDLRAQGHAIGCHSLRHHSAVDYVRQHGLPLYLEDDIRPAILAMQRHGFDPRSFAYPNSQNDAVTDAGLLTLFGRLRSGGRIPQGQPLDQVDHLFVPVDHVANTGLHRGCGIDVGSGRTLQHLLPALARAKNRSEILCLYAHRIGQPDEGRRTHHIPVHLLEEILQAVNDHGLAFHTFDDLPSCQIPA